MTDQIPQAEAPETEPKTETRTVYEEITVASSALIKQLQELIQAGNVRRLLVKDTHGKTLLEVPLTLGVVAGLTVAIWNPFSAAFLAAVAGVAALVAHVKVVIERYETPANEEKEKTSTPVAVKPADK